MPVPVRPLPQGVSICEFWGFYGRLSLTREGGSGMLSNLGIGAFSCCTVPAGLFVWQLPKSGFGAEVPACGGAVFFQEICGRKRKRILKVPRQQEANFCGRVSRRGYAGGFGCTVVRL